MRTRKGPKFGDHFALVRIECRAGTNCIAIAEALSGFV
jgi:hypothetical protein